MLDEIVIKEAENIAPLNTLEIELSKIDLDKTTKLTANTATAAPPPLSEVNITGGDNVLRADAETSAALYVNGLDTVLSMLGGVLGGGAPSKYSLSAKDKIEYTKVSADFFHAVGFKLSPAFAFLTATLMLIAPSANLIRLDMQQKKLQKNEATKSSDKKGTEKSSDITGGGQIDYTAQIKTIEQAMQIDEIKSDRANFITAIYKKSLFYKKTPRGLYAKTADLHLLPDMMPSPFFKKIIGDIEKANKDLPKEKLQDLINNTCKGIVKDLKKRLDITAEITNLYLAK